MSTGAEFSKKRKIQYYLEHADSAAEEQTKKRHEKAKAKLDKNMLKIDNTLATLQQSARKLAKFKSDVVSFLDPPVTRVENSFWKDLMEHGKILVPTGAPYLPFSAYNILERASTESAGRVEVFPIGEVSVYILGTGHENGIILRYEHRKDIVVPVDMKMCGYKFKDVKSMEFSDPDLQTFENFKKTLHKVDQDIFFCTDPCGTEAEWRYYCLEDPGSYDDGDIEVTDMSHKSNRAEGMLHLSHFIFSVE